MKNGKLPGLHNRGLTRIRRRKRSRLRYVIAAVAAIILLVLAIILAFILKHPSEEAQSSVVSSVDTTVVTTTTATTTTVTSTTTNGAVPTTTSAKAVDDKYFADACFIGDSRTEGLMLYSGPETATFFASKGLSVETAFTKPVIKIDSTTRTVVDALKNKHFGKVYVMLGVNELGWAYSSQFIKRYGELVDVIKTTQPGSKIFIQSIMPVSAAKSAREASINNPRIREYNALIQTMCAEKKVIYLNVQEAVRDKDGNLPADATSDGVHMNKAYCNKWVAYLRTHTEVPIATIPTTTGTSISQPVTSTTNSATTSATTKAG